MKQFNHVALGGTFDHLHDGHKALIDKAFKIGTHVSIGVTSDTYVKNKSFASVIESYVERKKALEKYLQEMGFKKRANLFRLHDSYGTAITQKNIEAIVVSRETVPNARKINSLRLKRFMPQLKIVLVPMVKGNNKKIIRSERIRQGEIDRQGNPFIKILTTKKRHIMPEQLRSELRKPLGKVYKRAGDFINTIEGPTLIVSVGDIITASLVSVGIVPDIQIIDFKSRRKKDTSVSIPSRVKPFRVLNSAGTLSQTLARALKKAYSTFFKTKQPQYVIVKGEEDLTALVAILLAPLGSIVVYGQYGLGIVMVPVTEKIKRQTLSLLGKFV